ncbi:MAG TPA: pseudouridine synthase [Candidatus Binatia bacterium]|nr:pseudouridine synthase [Candidatus Binatia bacterium]
MPLKGKVRCTGLARALSKLGYCSRSQAAEMIRAGRVQLNGNLQRDPERPVRIDSDRIMVDGHEAWREKKIYLMMNKPRGLVTTASDEKGRETVYSVLAGGDESLPWVAPVGRLDKASEGLLLLTNDSEWGARVAAPETHLEKTYHVQIASIESVGVIAAMMRGVSVDGQILRAKQCQLLRSGEKNCWIEIVLDEGKNRQIRRMLSGLAIGVLRLLRVSIGPLQLGTLAKGTYRSLSTGEKSALDRAIKKRVV